MTAAIIPLSGLHGANLARFQTCCDLVDANIRREDEHRERLLRDMRRNLAYAVQAFPVNVELADAFGARAANKLSLAIGARP